MSKERFQQHRALPVRQVDEVIAISCFQRIVNEVARSRCQSSSSAGPVGKTVYILRPVPRRGERRGDLLRERPSRLHVDVGMISDDAEVFASSWYPELFTRPRHFCSRPMLVRGAEMAESRGRTSGCVADAARDCRAGIAR